MKKKIYRCDNCKKVISHLWGRAFQTGRNNEGKTGTWCSRKCLDQYERCNWHIGFNGLGMPIFFCLTHGKSQSKYSRAKQSCYEELAKRLKKLTLLK